MRLVVVKTALPYIDRARDLIPEGPRSENVFLPTALLRQVIKPGGDVVQPPAAVDRPLKCSHAAVTVGSKGSRVSSIVVWNGRVT